MKYKFASENKKMQNMEIVMIVLGKCWNAGNSVIGLAIGGFYKLRNGKNCTVRMGRNAVEFCGCQLHSPMAGGMTLGNVILYRGQTLRDGWSDMKKRIPAKANSLDCCPYRRTSLP